MLKRLLLILIPIAIVVAWYYFQPDPVPQVAFARVTRETLVSTLNTNGKVEPIEWSAIRSETAGAVEKVDVQKGQSVVKGQLLVELDAGPARSELASAQAKIAGANAERQVLTTGGRSTELAEIESGLASARASSSTPAATWRRPRGWSQSKPLPPATSIPPVKLCRNWNCRFNPTSSAARL